MLNSFHSNHLRATNQNLYEVFQIRPVEQTLLFGITKRGWCYIVEDTCKAGAFRIHLVQYVSKSQTGTTHGNCSGSYVTYFQGDEVERAGVRCNIASFLRPYSLPNPLLQYGESDRQIQIYTTKFIFWSSYCTENPFPSRYSSTTWYISSYRPSQAQLPSGSIQKDCLPQVSLRWIRKFRPLSLRIPFNSITSLKDT